MSAPSVVYRAPPGRRARGSVRDDAPTSLDRSSSRSNERVARARSPAASSHGRARGRVVRRGEDSLEPRAGISAPRVRSSRRGGARLARGGSIRHVLFFRRVKSSRERSIRTTRVVPTRVAVAMATSPPSIARDTPPTWDEELALAETDESSDDDDVRAPPGRPARASRRRSFIVPSFLVPPRERPPRAPRAPPPADRAPPSSVARRVASRRRKSRGSRGRRRG